MSEKFNEDKVSESNEFDRKMKFVREQCGNALALQVLQAFFESEPVNMDLGLFFFESDFLSCISEENYKFIIELINTGAEKEWFFLISRAYDEKGEDFISFCSVFEFLFSKKISLNDVNDKYENCSSAEELRNFFYDEKKEITEEIEILNEQIKEQNDLVSQQQIVIDSLQQKNREQSEKMTVLTEENHSLKIKNSDIRAKLGEYHENLESAYQDALNHRKETLQVKVELSKLIRKYKNPSISMQRLQEQNEKLSLQISDIEKKYEDLLEKYKLLQNKKNSLENDMEHLSEKYKEEQKLNNDLSLELEKLNTILENLPESPADPDIPVPNSDKIDSIDSVDEETIFYDESDIVSISDGKNQFLGKIASFANVFSDFYAEKFENKPQSEQENIIFIKMMELSFEQEKVLAVKKLLRKNDNFSRLDLYKLVSKNPSGEEIKEFCKEMSAA